MNVLSIGTDAHTLRPGSAAWQRQKAYAEALGHLDLVVLTKGGEQNSSDGALAVFAARGPSRFARFRRGWQLARSLTRPDVVSVQDPFEIGLLGVWVARRFGVPLHVQVHTDFLSPGYRQLSLLNRARILLAGYVLRRAARIRVVSERIKKSIDEHYMFHKMPISVIPIFVDIERFRKAPHQGELLVRFAAFSPRFLVVARLEPEKNVALALTSFAATAPKNSCLIIVGEGSERTKLETLTRSLGIGPRVFFEGAQDPAPYYHAADLVLVTSRYEGYGLVIVEALASGIPVLSTDVGVAREAGAIVADPEHFSDAIREWLKGDRHKGVLHMPVTERATSFAEELARDIIATQDA